MRTLVLAFIEMQLRIAEMQNQEVEAILVDESLKEQLAEECADFITTNIEGLDVKIQAEVTFAIGEDKTFELYGIPVEFKDLNENEFYADIETGTPDEFFAHPMFMPWSMQLPTIKRRSTFTPVKLVFEVE